MSQIFISYKREERPIAQALAERLTARGYDVWWDVDLLPGEEYSEEIARVIRSASAAIVLWSEASVMSRFVRAEARLAMDQEILIPIRLDSVTPPLPFNEIHTLDFSAQGDGLDDAALEPLFVSLRKLVPEPVDVEKSDDEVKVDFETAENTWKVMWASVRDLSPESVDEYKRFVSTYAEQADSEIIDFAKRRIDFLKRKSRSGAIVKFGSFIAGAVFLAAAAFQIWDLAGFGSGDIESPAVSTELGRKETQDVTGISDAFDAEDDEPRITVGARVPFEYNDQDDAETVDAADDSGPKPDTAASTKVDENETEVVDNAMKNDLSPQKDESEDKAKEQGSSEPDTKWITTEVQKNLNLMSCGIGKADGVAGPTTLGMAKFVSQISGQTVEQPFSQASLNTTTVLRTSGFSCEALLSGSNISSKIVDLGRLHRLRTACSGRNDQFYRSTATKFIDQFRPENVRELVLLFNHGYNMESAPAACSEVIQEAERELSEVVSPFIDAVADVRFTRFDKQRILAELVTVSDREAKNSSTADTVPKSAVSSNAMSASPETVENTESCSGLTVEECYLLANQLNDLGVFSDKMLLHEENCERGYAKSCVQFGVYVENRFANSNTVSKLPFYEKACSLNDRFGCYNFGKARMSLLTPDGLEASKSILGPRCETDLPFACLALFELFSRPEYGSLDEASASLYKAKWCNQISSEQKCPNGKVKSLAPLSISYPFSTR